jgi:hypothetical protein
MPLILPSNSISAGGYEVDNSLRFNSGSSDDLVYTPSSTGNRRTFTWSVWVKRSKLGASQMTLFKKEGSGSDTNGNGNADYLGLAYFNSDDTLQVARNQEGDFVNVKTTRVFRDVSAWYHIIVSIDTTQGTGSNRVRCWVNGTEESLTFTITPTLNREFDFNQSGEAHHLGSSGAGSYLDGYLTECVFLDGTGVTGATSFGEFDADTGIWKPIDVSGLTFGTNGFYLPFENSAALGQDDSGNGNNFTVNNLTSIDQTTDTPTNNSATYNPLMNKSSGVPTMSNGNLTLTTNSEEFGSVSSIGASQGKWYCELKWDSGSYAMVGITGDPIILSTNGSAYAGITADSWSWHYSGNVYNNNSTIAVYNTFATSDILGIALDLTNNKLYFSKNGTWQNSADPAAGTNGISITASSSVAEGNYFIWVGNGSSAANATLSANFGSPPYTISSGNSDANGYGNFEYAVPSGYYALNTKNLAEYG